MLPSSSCVQTHLLRCVCPRGIQKWLPVNRNAVVAIKSIHSRWAALLWVVGMLPQACLCVFRLVQWCHGAAGFIVTMCKAHDVIGGNGEYLAAARRAADTLWERGLLKKVSSATACLNAIGRYCTYVMSPSCQ